ncbi:MAG: glycosyltransferase family 2 protein, partial [Phycisphaerae bacterium]|nr:glycosyltransferase family 2 protein [Phycisphaerae bacterium]
ALSTVTPMHNEEACIEEFVRRTDAALAALGRSYEIVIVSDGSTDRTESLIESLSATHPALRGVCLSRNMGQCSAIDAGIQESRGELVVVLDGDLQHLPEEIELLVKRAEEGFDLVSGSRGPRVESLFLRRIPSRIANWLLRAVSGCPVRDMGGFKCLRGDLARSLRLRAGQHRLLPALVWQRGGSVSEVIVSAPPRFAGKSHYGLSRSLDVLFDIVMLWLQNSFKSRPIYLFGRLALVLLAIDAMIMPVLLWQKFVDKIDMGTRPPFLIAIMLFLAALFLMTSGFVLELVSDGLNATSGVRPWVVRRRIHK